jgi:hypothetical protein
MKSASEVISTEVVRHWQRDIILSKRIVTLQFRCNLSNIYARPSCRSNANCPGRTESCFTVTVSLPSAS